MPPRPLIRWLLNRVRLAGSGATAAARPFLGWLSVLWFLGARGSRGCGALVPVLSSCPSLAWAGLLSLGAWFALLWFLLSCGSFFVSNPEFMLSLFGCGARLTAGRDTITRYARAINFGLASLDRL